MPQCPGCGAPTFDLPPLRRTNYEEIDLGPAWCRDCLTQKTRDALTAAGLPVGAARPFARWSLAGEKGAYGHNK